MRTLFLDIDGPLTPDRIIAYHPLQRKAYPGRVELPDHVDYWKFDDVAVHMLNFLYDLEPYDTVISSSWRRFCTKEQIRDLFDTNGLAIHLVLDWATPEHDHRYKCTRAAEIEQYIVEHPEITDYFILDDVDSGSSLQCTSSQPYTSYSNTPHSLNPDRIFLVDTEMGIDIKTYKKMRNLFVPGSLTSRGLW